MAGLRFSEDQLTELERAGARIRDRQSRPEKPADLAPPQALPPAPSVINNEVMLDATPIADAMRDGAQEMAAAIVAAVAKQSPPPAQPSVKPITGFDVQIMQRDMDGAITRMKISVLRG